MVVKVRGGYNTESGWPADESTGVEFQNDVEIPGQFKGGGAGFGWGDAEIPAEYGPGGFFKPRGVPSLVGPTAGQQGTSISSVPRGGAAPAQGGPQVFRPGQQPLRPGMSPAVRTGPSPATDATFAPGKPVPGAAPRPWWLPSFTPAGIAAAIAGSGYAGIANENQPGNVPAHGTGPEPVMTPEQMHQAQNPDYPKSRLLDQPAAYPQDYPASRLLDRPAGYPQDYPVSRLLDSPAAAAAAAAAPAARGGRATPAAAGPAAVAQQPNLGNYGASPFTTLDYRPNSGPNERNRGSPVATALDLSRLFGGGAPAAAPAPTAAVPASILAQPDLAQRVPLSKTPLPPSKPKKKSSSSSQGGGF